MKESSGKNLCEKFQLGDSVMIFPDKKIGIVCEKVNAPTPAKPHGCWAEALLKFRPGAYPPLWSWQSFPTARRF